MPFIWVLVPLLILPNTMFKYFQPAYPALALAAAYSVKRIPGERANTLAAVVIASSLTVAGFVFYPMTLSHFHMNIKSASEFANSLNPGETSIAFIPTTSNGKWLEGALLTLRDQVDYFMKGEVTYYPEEQLGKLVNRELLPDIVLLTSDSTRPPLEDSFQEFLSREYQESYSYDDGNKAGVWKVFITVYVRREQ